MPATYFCIGAKTLAWAQLITINEQSLQRPSLTIPGLMTAEKIILVFLAYATVAAFLLDLSPYARALIAGLNLAAGAVVVAVSRIERTSRLINGLREWLPTALILVAYRESGLFLKPDATHRLDNIFIQWDRVLLQNGFVDKCLSLGSPWLQEYLEFSYLLCYPLVLLGFAALYLIAHPAPPSAQHPPDTSLTPLEPAGLGTLVGANNETDLQHRRLVVDHFWTTVLLAVLTCYVLFPFFPLTPPRVLFHDLPGPATGTFFRKLNGWVLGQYSVQACIFPSGHVAAVTAVGLVVRSYLPRLGVLFVVIAVSIAVATVYGRYHYAADAVAGAVVGSLAFVVSRRNQPSR